MTLRAVWRYPLQGLNYALFMAVVWYFSTSPRVRVLDETESVLTVAFAHAGALREPCRALSAAEQSEQALNMRQTVDCPRARSPVAIRASLGNETIWETVLEPPGIYEDGGVDVFHSIRVKAGSHDFEIAMSDSIRSPGFNHRLARSLEFRPGEIVLVRFETGQGFFIQD